MPTKRPYLVAAALWLAMGAVFFWPVIFQGKVLAPLDIMDSLLRPWATGEKIELHNAFTYDAISQYLPYDYSVYQSLRQDGYIGWNPYTHSGSSIVENTMICPGDWRHHLYRFLPFWDAWNLGIILQFSIAGLGMLVLLRHQKIPAAYALIGVVAFGFYSQFTLWIYHRWVLGAMCWAPWILWALFRAREKNRLIDPASVIFIALAFRGGHLQACLTIVLMVVFVALADWWRAPSKFSPAQIFRSLIPYALTGFLAAILTLDVLIETVPPLLHGGKTMAERPWSETLRALPTLASSIVPTLTGTPQGLDASKFFHVSLFTIKFMGACALLLAIGGCASRKAPLAAKVLMLAALFLPFTPADRWLYSRFTAVFALGAAWLAAWVLHDLSTRPRHALLWKRVFTALAITAGCWLAVSLIIHWQQPYLTTRLHDIVASELTADKYSRLDWMFARSSVFLETLKIWHPYNLAFFACITAGLFAASRIHRDGTRLQLFATLAALCTFGELFTFSKIWITFSERPTGQSLYEMPEWAQLLNEEVGNGTILLYDRTDFDYLQLNTPSAYGIRFAEGYETVTPKRIDPYSGDHFDPARCASAGISHIMVGPKKNPGLIPGWDKVIDSNEYILYRNPQFVGICHADLADGSQTPLVPNFQSPNRREIQIPSGTRTVTLLESFNPGWKYSTDGETWLPAHANDLHAIQVNLAHPTTTETTRLFLQYRPAYLTYYRPVIGLTLAGLVVIGVFRHLRIRS
jgi:hypothetical protein